MRDPGGPRRHQKKHRGEPSPTEVEPLVGTHHVWESYQQGEGGRGSEGKRISLTRRR